MIQTIFTCVSLNTEPGNTNELCKQLPIAIKTIPTVEDLFPLLSNPNYHTDFVCINAEMLKLRPDALDIFDIIKTLSTLIKSTVYRTTNSIACKRDTKILVSVDETTDLNMIKEVINFPDIISVGWNFRKDFDASKEYIEQLLSGNYAHHAKVAELLKNRKKIDAKKTNTISLTVRQTQVLHLLQDRGSSNKVIAKTLGLAESTVKLHIGAILKKYNVRNRTQLAVFSKHH